MPVLQVPPSARRRPSRASVQACLHPSSASPRASSLPSPPSRPPRPTPCSTPQWEGCLNRTLCVDAAAADLTCLWDAPMATMVGPVSIDCAAEQLSEDELSTEDDAPPPAFK